MSEVNFKSLQNLHESLLQKQQKVSEEDQQGFIKEVRAYIEQAKGGGSNIASTRERDQIRANLRYWANYIYNIDKTFPDTDLAPSMVASNPFSVNVVISLISFVLVIAAAGISVYSGTNRPVETEVPVNTAISDSPVTDTPEPTTVATEAVVPPAETETITPGPSGLNVILSSPANGENIAPNVVFKGTYQNLIPGWTIHVFFIKGDKLLPIKDNYIVPKKADTGDWEIATTLKQNRDELSREESYTIVPAVCFDNSCRELLNSGTEVDINSLPSTFYLFKDTSRVVYRKGFMALQETRLVYSIFHEGKGSFDLYTSKPDGSDIRQITNTHDINETSPNLSPDGTKIVYVKRLRGTNGDPIYAIAIMGSNGENDHEITAWTTNILEIPQWSSDSTYISYEVGKQQGGLSYWNIHIYEVATKMDRAIFEESERLEQHYHTWMPDTNGIIFDARPQDTGTLGLDIVSIDILESTSHFFDKREDEIRPNIKSFENGYLLTYTSVDADKNGNVFAVILDSDWKYAFEPIRLTFRRAGEIVDGLRIANADYPISDPDSNSIYYMRNANIYKVEFVITNGKIELLVGPKKDTDFEHYGDLVIETGLKDEISGFDVGLMDTFFPLK